MSLSIVRAGGPEPGAPLVTSACFSSEIRLTTSLCEVVFPLNLSAPASRARFLFCFGFSFFYCKFNKFQHARTSCLPLSTAGISGNFNRGRELARSALPTFAAQALIQDQANKLSSSGHLS